jgi:hypothetical protein
MTQSLPFNSGLNVLTFLLDRTLDLGALCV